MKQITIAGRVGKDGVLRSTQSGDQVLGFSVAVNDGYGHNKSTVWFDCSIWGKRAEALAQYLVRGTPVTAAGELGTREHDGKTYLTIRVNEVELQGGTPSTSAPKPERSSYDRDDERTHGGGSAAALDDEIPFAPEFR